MASESTFNNLIERGILVSPDVMEAGYEDELINNVVDFFEGNLDHLDKEIIDNYIETKNQQEKNSIKIIKDYMKEPKKRTYQDFVSMFNNRFNKLSDIIKKRREMEKLTSLARLTNKSSNEKVAVLGMVMNKNYTKNEHIVLELEDKSGTATIIVRKQENSEVYNKAEDIVLDEVIGVTGTWLNSALFADEIYHPDVPVSKELKKQKEEEYVLFIGDQHFGSKVFMEDEFNKLIKWLKQETGNETQRNIASKVKYIVMTGDIIEGAGTYPGQEHDLKEIDVKKQYEEAAKWLKKIPSHIQMVTTTGNHDVGRLAEPQEKPYYDLAKPLYEIPNLKLVSNPSWIRIQNGNSPGFDFLLYHGGSLIYYSQNIPSIRAKGGQKRSDLILKFLLQRRHLAPTHSSTLVVPDAEEDYLLMDQVPDFLVTGHIHRAMAANYRNVTMINASCWTETTDDQIKRGLEPQPARAILTNLKTRDVKMLNFLSKEAKDKEEEKTKQARGES